MHFISTTNTRHNDYRNSSLSRHNTAERTNSYSPQYSPKLDTTDYHSSSSRYYKRESEVSKGQGVIGMRHGIVFLITKSKPNPIKIECFG